MKRNNIFLIGWLILVVSGTDNNIFAQRFVLNDSIPVIVNNDTLQYPWAGGLNLPMFSTIDLNHDGIPDLFMFDKSTNRVLTFINKGIPDSVSYEYAPQYESDFPSMTTWAFLKDYNCDGEPDIFTLQDQRIAVYRNDYTPANGLKFTKIANVLYADINGSYSNIFLGANSIPCFTDVDNDGDIDILVYAYSTSYYQNMSQEDGNNCDSLHFKLVSSCWGHFSSQGIPANSCALGINCKGVTPPDTSSSTSMHNGQAIYATDLNGDGTKEAILGDIIQNNLVMLTNTGTPTNANMTVEDTTFPKYDIPSALMALEIPTTIDVNNDGLKDLLVSPAAPNISDNYQSVWYYKNVGTSTNAHFHYQQNNLFQDQMIDVGEGCYPVFFDYNGDGLMDLVIGNYGYYAPSRPTGYKTTLSLYENVGTATDPEFQLVTNDYMGLDSLNLSNVCPTFGDLDHDGDQDMIVGFGNGTLNYYENTAGPGNTAHFVLSQQNYQSIDVGQFATPQLVDVNGDGLLDLLIGKRNGSISYYQNTGTIYNPVFTLDTTEFGGINVKKTGYITGYAVPLLYRYKGVTKMLVGTESGYIYQYDNIDNNLQGKFDLVDSMFDNIWVGSNSSPTMAEITGDSLPDLVVGNYGGGVSFYQGAQPLGISEINTPNTNFTLYPNPANNQLFIKSDDYSRSPLNVEATIYNTLGQKVKTFLFRTGSTYKINTASLSDGIYICQLKYASMNLGIRKKEYRKFVVTHN